MAAFDTARELTAFECRGAPSPEVRL